MVSSAGGARLPAGAPLAWAAGGATLSALSAFEQLTSAVIPLLVAFFNLLIAGHALAGARRNRGWLTFGVGPAGVGVWALAWFLSLLDVSAVGSMQVLGGLGGALALSGFAWDGAMALDGRRRRRAAWASGLGTLLLLGALVAVALRAEAPAYVVVAAGTPRVLALGLLGLVGLTAVSRARAEDAAERALGRRVVQVLSAGIAGYGALAVAALLDAHTGVDPLLLVALVAEAIALVYVLHGRVALHIVLSRAVTSALLSLVVVSVVLVALWSAGVSVDVALVASALAIALFSGLLFLGLAELVTRGVTRVLFPGAARMEEALAASRTELASLKRRLDHAERLAIVGELAASVAHEIKNPLSPIRGYAQHLLTKVAGVDPADRPLFEKALGIIVKEADVIDARVHQLLEVSRGDRAAPTLDAATELHVVLLEAIAVAEGEPAVREVRRRLDPAVGWVEGEADGLRSALANVLKNAAEAMEPVGGGVIEVTTRLEGARVVVEVVDEGVGVEAAAAERAFESFFTTKRGGTGLGLAISRSAVESAGGTVELLPRQDARGACVRVVLPARPSR